MSAPWSAARRAAQAITWQRIRNGEGFLYAIRVRGLIKIGFSTVPVKRAREQRGYMAAVVPGTILQEKAIHRALRSLRAGNDFETYPVGVLAHPAVQSKFGGIKLKAAA